MLRAPNDENKENVVRVKSCKCVYSKPRINYLVAQPVAEFLSKTKKHKNALQDITHAKNTLTCRCKPRSKSSTEEHMASNIKDMHNKNRGSSTSSTISQEVDKYLKDHATYQDKVRQEIRDILEDKEPQYKSLESRSSKIVPKSASYLTSSSQFSFDYDITSKIGLSNPSVVKYKTLSSSSTLTSSTPYQTEAIGKNTDTENNVIIHGKCLSQHGLKKCSKIEIYVDSKEDLNSRKQKQVHPETGLKYKIDEVKAIKSVSIPSGGCSSNARKSHPQEYKASQGKLISPILPNPYTKPYTFISAKRESVRDPKIRRRALKRREQMWQGRYVGDIYNEEYILDIITYIKTQEIKTTLPPNFFQRHNPGIHKCRASILNWILGEQSYLNFSESEYYLAVNLTDHVLTNVHVPVNMIQLLMLATLSIAMKLIGNNTNTKRLSTLSNLCNGAFVTRQLLRMEQKILHVMNFNIHSIEPTIHVNYFLKTFNLHKDTKAKITVYYVLDSFSLTTEFSCTRISMLAAASVMHSVLKLSPLENKTINEIFTSILTPEELIEVTTLEKVISQLTNISNEDYVYKEPFRKFFRNMNDYNKPEYLE